MPPRREPDTDDDAPWLSSVEAERDATTFVPQRRLIAGIVAFLVLLAIIVGGIYWLTARTRQGGASGTPVTNAEDAPLIEADPGPYKVAPDPDAPSGMPQPDGTDANSASQGDNTEGSLDPNKLPEQPLQRPGATGSAPADLLPPSDGASETVVISPAGSKPAVTVVKPEPPRPAAPLKPLAKPEPLAPGAPAAKPVKPATGGVALQLGAFSTSAKANEVWSDYAKRFKYLGGLGKAVQAVERDGKTLYRLRAVGVANREAADDLCSRLRVAGVVCVVAQ